MSDPTTPLRRRPLWAGRAAALLGIALVSLNLRAAVAALSPISHQIAGDIPLSAVGLGLLGTLPPLCFALSGLLTPYAQRWSRLETLVLWAMILTCAGSLVRSLAADYTLLALGSVLLFLGSGVANVALPPLFKDYFGDRIATITSIFVTLMGLSSVLPPLLAVPLANAMGWRFSLGIWAAVAFVAILPWLPLAARGRRGQRAAPPGSAAAAGMSPGSGTGNGAGAGGGTRGGASTSAGASAGARGVGGDVRLTVWRSPLAWCLAVLFAAASILAYASFAWLPQILMDRAGTSPELAGLLLAVFSAMGLPSSVLVPMVAARLRTVWLPLCVSFGGYVLGLGGLLLAPHAAPILWVALMGVGTLAFPLVLLLINLRTRTQAGAVALSGFEQGIGYLIGASGPLLVGLLHDLTDDWTLPILFMLLSAAVIIAVGPVVAPRNTIEDEAVRRHARAVAARGGATVSP